MTLSPPKILPYQAQARPRTAAPRTGCRRWRRFVHDFSDARNGRSERGAGRGWPGVPFSSRAWFSRPFSSVAGMESQGTFGSSMRWRCVSDSSDTHMGSAGGWTGVARWAFFLPCVVFARSCVFMATSGFGGRVPVRVFGPGLLVGGAQGAGAQAGHVGASPGGGRQKR